MACLLRKIMDVIYRLSGGIAGGLLVILFVMVVAQMATRWTGHNIPGLTAIAGYVMGATSFFGLAYALKEGAHIRVSLLAHHLGAMQKPVEIISVGVSLVLALLFCFYAGKTTYVSYAMHDVSLSQDATPLWIPQLSMFIGTLFFALAVADLFVREITTPKDQILIVDTAPRE